MTMGKLQSEWANCKASGRIAKRVDELQSEWANCKASGRLGKGRMEKKGTNKKGYSLFCLSFVYSNLPNIKLDI
ncbi:hypothetical protein POVWA2_014570 [Plasmodium ovale wallikeri]|uniref:Uncharacterized protein n=1 Tax=Plasmodium ovale wallikeri TaxID=864142 RepID=A0A1A8YPR4_PLAOA|nr:hypothetical protein POVWA2_014570 [Plasmodium ovale wallikeri]